MVTEPGSFDEELFEEWNVWVLDHGLPPLPAKLEKGQSVPVARWAGEQWGAVFHLQWNWDEDEPDDDYVATEIQVLRRVEGRWQTPSGSGGSNWHEEHPFTRWAVPGRAVHLGGLVWHGADDWAGAAMDGIAGIEAALVTVVSEGREESNLIDNDLGIVLAAFNGELPAMVIVQDAEGVLLAREQFVPDR
ncbi:MAG: hypothetical protein QOI61_2083 [Actinomycetota bacterium]